jgi:hypothetical protein
MNWYSRRIAGGESDHGRHHGAAPHVVSGPAAAGLEVSIIGWMPQLVCCGNTGLTLFGLYHLY